MKRGTPATRARKRYGQHFLHDKAVIQRLVSEIIAGAGQAIFEIGPGRGALTLPLLRHVDHLDVIEIDRDLAGALEKQCPTPEKLIVYNNDVLKFDFRAHAKGRKLRIVGNLPYNISTPLLFHLLEQIDCIGEMLFMLQKEVADRICAKPGTREYGRLAIMVQSLCRVESLFTVGAGAFTPAPRVQSEVIRLMPLPAGEIPIRDRNLFSRVVRTAFSHRRKTLRNALKGLVGEDLLLASDISPELRPQELTIADYTTIANTLTEAQTE